MTVSYNQDIINSQTLTFLRIIFRWRGSLWKSVAYEVILWTIAYYSILLVYRFMLPPKWQIEFEHIAKYTDSKMDYLPLTFMLGFFVTFVVDRWKQIFANIGFVDGFAFFISTFIRGVDSESRMIRRNLVRYLCLTQVLVLRDISIRVRKRFPTMESLVDAGYLQTHEQILMEMNENGFPKYWMPIHWIFNICHDLHGRNRITGASYDNILQETKKFREQLQTLMNYDWVPVPLAYPQVICLATRIYFLLCLFGRQFRIHEQVDSHFYVEYYFPMMTVLQLICLMGWLKVAEALLNPMGDDDDDYECNYIIDRNKAVGMTMVDECHGQMPKQMPDTIGLEGEKAMYSEKSVNDAQNPLVGSATLVDHDDLPAEGEHVKMIERKPTIIPGFEWDNDKNGTFICAEILAERKKSRLSRVWSRAKRRRSSEPIQMRHQIHPSPTNLKSTTMADFGGLRFACSEGGNDLRDGLRGAKKISEIFPNKSDQNANFQMANSPENSPKLSQNDQSWPQHLERVSEEEDGSISTLNSLEMAELGLDPEEFSSKKGRRRKEGKVAK